MTPDWDQDYAALREYVLARLEDSFNRTVLLGVLELAERYNKARKTPGGPEWPPRNEYERSQNSTTNTGGTNAE